MIFASHMQFHVTPGPFTVWSFSTTSPLIYNGNVNKTELGLWVTIFYQSLKHTDSII